MMIPHSIPRRAFAGLLLAGATALFVAPASAVLPNDKVILGDWHFDEEAGTILENTVNSIEGGARFQTSPAASATTGTGVFRIQRPALTTLFGNALLEMPPTGKMWIVADIDGWNLINGTFSDFRVGFTNAPGNPDSTSSGQHTTDHYVTAEFSVRRDGVGGFAATSDGGERMVARSNPNGALSHLQTMPVRVVLEYDRDNNTFEVFVSLDRENYTSVGSESTNPDFAPNRLRFMALNSFDQTGTYFDVDRVFVVAGEEPPPPAGNVSLAGHADPFSQRYGDVGGEGDIAVTGTFLTNNSNGVGIFDISDPSNPILTADYNPDPGNTRFQDTWVRDGIGYFGCWRISGGGGTNGVHVVDLSDPYDPRTIAIINGSIGAHDIVHTLFIDGDFLYTADHQTNVVKVTNISDPANPAFVRDIQTTDSERIHQITVRDGRLFTSGWGGHTDIYDISEIDLPGAPAPRLGVIQSGSHSHSSWPTEDGNVLVSSRETIGGDVRLFDIRDPANPELILLLTHDMVGIGDYIPHNPVIVGDLLYLSWYQNGLQVFDISEPARPVRVGFYDTFPQHSTATWNGNWGVYPLIGPDRVLLSDMANGLYIVDATDVLTATDNYPPLIVAQPEDREVVEGSRVEISVDATGSEPMSYQWQRNGANLPDSNNPTLVLDDVQTGDGGSYRVRIENAAGEIESASASLNVIAAGDAAPAQVTSHPEGQTVSPGDIVTFSVSATGSATIEYQWYRNGEPIDGADGQTLTIGPVMVADAGAYSVHVSNTAGGEMSEDADLEIEDDGFIYALRVSVGFDGAVASWRTRQPATSFVEYNAGHSHFESTALDSAMAPMHAEFDSMSPKTPTPSTRHSVYLGGLDADTEHSFRVIAYDSGGTEYESPELVFFTGPAPDEPPEAEVVPAWWAEHFFGESVDGNKDFDGDGWTVWEEYIAGTSPVNPRSRPATRLIRYGGELQVTFWPIHPGRQYRLESTADLGSGEWTTESVPKETSAEGRRTYLIDDPAGEATFYRVVIEP